MANGNERRKNKQKKNKQKQNAAYEDYRNRIISVLHNVQLRQSLLQDLTIIFEQTSKICNFNCIIGIVQKA